MSIECPACKRQSTSGRFCSWCAAPLALPLAETALITASVNPASVNPARTSQLVPPLPSEEGRFVPGTVLAGRYRISGLLGRGGMGEVYRSTDLSLHQTVALKFLPEPLAGDDGALARFYNEVRIARQVTHQNVCRVYDIGQVEGLHFISMEFVDGEDLASLLHRIGRLPIDKVIEIARKLCAGLTAAHERGVLHRDLKPANIMIDKRGQVIIMDFGLAGLSDQLQADVRSGTPAYMSPEQLAGTQVTSKSDLYALGLVLYELLSGKRPFEARTMAELLDTQQRGAPVRLTSIVTGLDPAIERVILRCLAPDPKDRPSSALAIAAALPGADPLAAALAAGETPSPELIAAAGETEGLRPKVASAWLAAALIGFTAIALIAPFHQITEALHLDTPPEALAHEARVLLENLGYTARPVDRVWGFEYNLAYQDYLARHPNEAAARWKNPTAGEPPLITYWYRESPSPAPADRGTNVAVSYTNPPLERPRMIRLRLSPDGKLTQLEVVPPQVETAATPASFDWKRMFEAAGLDMGRFQPAVAEWTPLASWDQRAAWTAGSLRVEAAAWRGRPISFYIVGPWTVPDSSGSPPAAGRKVYLTATYMVFAAACILAWLNFRTRKTDQGGATKLATLCWLGFAGGNFLHAHHVAALAEISTFWKVVLGTAAGNAVWVWIVYLALEPSVRRWWPHTMISWSRYVVKGWRDPLVGRDLLYSAAIGAMLALLDLAPFASPEPALAPAFPDVSALSGVDSMLGSVLLTFADRLFGMVITFFFLFLLRLALRKEWLAAIGTILVYAAVMVAPAKPRPLDATIAVGGFAILTLVILRYGLIAAIFAYAIENILQLPHTLDFSKWYAPTTFVPLILVGLLAIYGFRTSLGGRRLIEMPD